MEISIKSSWLWLLLLLTAFLSPGFASGQSAITITGPGTACVGDVPTYTFSPTIAGTTYTWSVTSQGTIQTPGASAGLITWVSAGSATVTVTGKDINGQTVAQGTLPVSVGTTPNPVLTASSEVNCMPLDTVGGDKAPPRDTSSCKKVCAYSKVYYSVANIPGATYSWSVNGDVVHFPAGNTCEVDWGSAGYGNVTVTVTHGSCTGSASMCVQIIEGPQAHFLTMPNTPSPDHISVCLNSTVIFIDQSTSPAGSPIVSWVWDFGDGTYSSQGVGTQNGPVEHVYVHPGSFIATLTVTNACGCSSSFLIKVEVSKLPGVKIECPRVSCEGEVLKYYIDNPDCQSGSWQAIGGQVLSQNPQEATIIWNQIDPSGFGYLSYTTECGDCPGTTTIKVPVMQQHGFIHGTTSVCPDKQYEYTLPQWPTTKFTWSVTGNGTLEGTDQPNKVVVLTGASGSYTLHVEYCNTLINCSGSADLTATIMPPALATGPSVVCLNEQHTYNLSGASTATWTLTDPNGITTVYNNVGSISPTFTLSGSYTLEIAGNFCAPEPMKIKVDEKPATPTSIIGPDKTCIGVPVQYTAQAPVAGTVFEWQNMNGSVNASGGTSTYATFTSLSGTLKVFRVTTDAAQCKSDPLVKVVQPDMPSSISINYSIPTAPEVCGSTQWGFDASYTNGDLYDWSIIPANAASVVSGNATPNVQILFNNPLYQGQTVAVALAITKCGATEYDTAWFQVNSIPDYTASASPNPACAGVQVAFTLTPTLQSGSTANWDFGDGSTSSNAVHTYANTGATATYNPTVTITSNCGISNTIQVGALTVLPAPVVTVTPGAVTGCNTVSATLAASITTGIGGTNTFAWSGPTTSPPPPSCGTCTQWNINQFGDYQVTVTNSNGCSSTSNIVHVTEVCPVPPCTGNYPQLVSSSSSFVSCGRVKATVHYSVNSCTILSQNWISPVEAQNIVTTTGTTATATASFPDAGYYTFAYKVTYTNSTGDTCYVAFPQTVYVPFVGGMLYSVACGSGSNYVVTIFDHSHIFPGENINHSYAYRPGTSGTWITITGAGLSVTKNLPAGTYQIREVINSSTTPAAPSCTMIETIVLPAKPVANFTFTSDVAPNTPCERDVPVHFTNTSTPLPLSGLEFLWDFGGTPDYTNNQQAPGKMFNSSPGQTVILTVTDPNTGCVSTKQQTVQVANDPYWDGNKRPRISTNPNPPVCEGTPITLSYQLPISGGTAYPPSYQWFLNNNPIPNATSGSYGATVDGGYRVIGTDVHGCRAPSEFKTIAFIHVPPAVISGKTDYCDQEAFTLNGFAGNVTGLTYEWRRNPGNVLVGTGSSIEQTLGVGTVSYTLTLTLNGCTSVSQVFPVTIHANPPDPVPAFNIVNCNPYTVELTATNPQSGTYNWSNGASGSPAYAYAGGAYRVVFTNQYGCRSTDSIHVPRSPEEYLWIFPTGCFCQSLFEGTRCGRDKPYITGPIISFAHWYYLFNGTANASGVGYVPPYYNFYPNGTYNLKLDNGYCTATSGDMYVGGDYCDRTGQRPTGIYNLNDLLPMLQLAPNPAKNEVQISYRLVASGGSQSLEIYDQLGRKLKSIDLEGLKGSLKLPLGGYAAGTYQVLLKQDGKVIKQSKLSVTH